MKKFKSLLLVLCFYIQAYPQCSGLSVTVDKSSQCAPGLVKFTLQGAPKGSSLMWDFGKGFGANADTVYEFYLDPTIVNVSVKIAFPDGTKCQVTQNGIAQIRAKPEPSFKISRNKLCDGPDSVTLVNTTPHTRSIAWIVDGTNYPVGDIRQIHYFKSIGEKDLSMVVTDSFGCRAVKTFRNIAIVHPDVEMIIDADQRSGCITKEVQLTAKLNARGETITTHYWTFEGANISYYIGEQPPKLTFRNPGKFDVTLRVSTENGCIHEITQDEFFRFGDSIKLDVQLSDSLLCLNEVITVKSGVNIDGEYKWTFKGSPEVTKVSEQEYKLKYVNPGNFDIQLELSHNGCYSSTILPNAVKVKKVVAAFQSKDNYHCYTPHLTHLTNNSTSADNSPLQYEWAYFDQSGKRVARSRNENDSFASPDWGRYDVRLIAKDTHGCVDTMMQRNFIRVFKIMPGFTSQERIGCVNQLITVNQSTPPSSYISTDTFHWILYDRDDTTILHSHSGPKLEYTFAKPGFYDVKMYAANTIGCRDSIKHNNYLEIIEPKIGFTVSDTVICKGGTITLKATTEPNHAPFKHKWFLSNADGSITKTLDFDTARVRSIQMDDPGIYDIHYMHKIENGCFDTLTKKQHLGVNGVSGVIQLDQTDGCNGMMVNPRLTVTNNTHRGFTSDTIRYTWSLLQYGENNIATGLDRPNPKLTINASGAYNVSLRAVNSSGCAITTTSTNIYVGVEADFRLDRERVCAGDEIKISNESRLNPTSLRWNIIGSGKYHLDETFNPLIFKPLSNDSYTIELIAEKQNTCFDTMHRMVESIVVTSGFELADTHLFCAPAYAQFYATSQNADSFYWNFGDGNKISTSDISIANIYERNTGNASGFDVRLISKNNLGCADTLLVPEAIRVIGPVPKFKLHNFVGCEPLAVVFEDKGRGYSSYLLNYQDGSPLDSTNFGLHVFKINNSMNTQKFVPSMFATDSLGCSAIFQSADTVLVRKSPVALPIQEQLDGCLPYGFQLNDNTLDVVKKTWVLDTNTMGNASQVLINNPAPGMHLLSLEVENSLGCRDTVQKTFVAHIAPSISLVNRLYCLDQPDTIRANKLTNHNIVHWIWKFGSRPSPDTTTAPTLSTTFTNSGLYTVNLEAIDNNGCIGKSQTEILISSPTEIPKGAINFVSVTEDNDVWVSWDVAMNAQLKKSIVVNSNGESLYQEDISPKALVKIDQLNVAMPTCYSLFHVNECEVKGEYSDPHCPIVLRVQKGNPFELILSWNAYQGWNMVDEYAIIRCEPGQDYSEVARVPGTKTTYLDTALCSVKYRYFVIAIQKNTGFKSESSRSEETPDYLENEMATDIQTVSVSGDALYIAWEPSNFSMTLGYEVTKYDATFTDVYKKFELKQNRFNITDEEVEVDKMSYIYTVRTIDHCNSRGIAGLKGKSILLSIEYENNSSHLNWTPYESWYDGVKYYEIQLLKKSGYVKVGEVDGSSLSFTDAEIHDVLDDYCYRVIAHSYEADVTSISNQVCVRGASIVWVPSAFSPNEDDLNSTFKPLPRFVNLKKDNTYQTYEMTIHNRWGEKLFITNDVYEGWDGTYGNQPCQSESYMYHIRVTGLDDVIYNYKGLVRLVR